MLQILLSMILIAIGFLAFMTVTQSCEGAGTGILEPVLLVAGAFFTLAGFMLLMTLISWR